MGLPPAKRCLPIEGSGSLFAACAAGRAEHGAGTVPRAVSGLEKPLGQFCAAPVASSDRVWLG